VGVRPAGQAAHRIERLLVGEWASALPVRPRTASSASWSVSGVLVGHLWEKA
jgi:hypothetical protein